MHDGDIGMLVDLVDPQAIVTVQSISVQTNGDGMVRVDAFDQIHHSLDPRRASSDVRCQA